MTERHGGRGGHGAGGRCVCLKCGAAVPHRAGMRCMEERCPACGAALVREGSTHHLEALERKARRDATGGD